MKIIEFARQFVDMEISVIPLYHRNKKPILPAWEPYTKFLPTSRELQQWFPTDWNNYAVICGWNNLVVIDFDHIDYFNIWTLVQPDLSNVAFKVRTRKGMHVYLTTESPVANDKRISIKGGIDVQAQGKYVVGPGCIHPSGHVYESIGEMFFPMVRDIETILPLDLFPRVRVDDVKFEGTPVEFHPRDTEYQCDPFAAASMDSMDLITKVKQSIRIESLFPDARRTSTDGRWLAARCIFHDDHNPSFWIDTHRQLCGCAVCGMKPMDILNLYSRMHNISERDAVLRLAEEIGVWK